MSSKLHADKVSARILPEKTVDFENFFQQTGGPQGPLIIMLIRPL